MLNKFILLDCSICVFNQKVKYLYTQSKAQAGESRLDYSKSSVYNISCLACAQLYRCWAAVLATDTGVSRYDLHGCQASPRRCLCLNSPVSNLAVIKDGGIVSRSMPSGNHIGEREVSWRDCLHVDRKIPLAASNSSAWFPPGDCIGTCVQSTAPNTPGNAAMA